MSPTPPLKEYSCTKKKKKIYPNGPSIPNSERDMKVAADIFRWNFGAESWSSAWSMSFGRGSTPSAPLNGVKKVMLDFPVYI